MANKNEGTEVVEKVVMRPLADLVRNPKNPRKSDPQGLKDLCESIKRNPAYFNARPILLSDRTGELVIIAGERRSEAAAILEMTLVPDMSKCERPCRLTGANVQMRGERDQEINFI